MRAFKDLHEALVALRDQVIDSGREAKFLHLSPALAEQLEACNGDNFEGMTVRVNTELAHGEARVTADETGRVTGDPLP